MSKKTNPLIKENITLKKYYSFEHFYLSDIENLLEEVKSLVPKEYLKDVTFEYHYDEYWGSTFEAFYYRKETEEEKKNRLLLEKSDKKAQKKFIEERDYKEYERLKKKFEGK